MKNNFDIRQGNAKEVLSQLNSEGIMINCVVTSPPYFDKRQYGDSDQEIGKRKKGSKLEDDVDVFIQELVDVFDAVPLHPLGSVWVNLGDKRDSGKLLMIPEQFALEMRRRGWNLVDNVIWAKVIDEENGETEGGCMIEPTTARLNGNGWEPFYRFTKCDPKDAWVDICAVRIPREEKVKKNDNRYLPKELMTVDSAIDGRSLHNVWRIKMGQSKIKHFAVFPESLCERPIAMTCPMQVCENGDLRTRIVEMVEYDEGRSGARVFGKYTAEEDSVVTGRIDTGKKYIARKPVTVGWTHENQDYQPGVVLDPFCGSGTTGRVALKLGRSFIGIDLYEEYVNIARDTCRETIEDMAKKNLNPWKLFQ